MPIGRWRGRSWVSTTLGIANWLFTSPWNLVGFPAASLPAGLSSDRAPIGAQLVAPPGAETLLLSVMAQIEQLRPWPRWTGARLTPDTEKNAEAGAASQTTSNGRR